MNLNQMLVFARVVEEGSISGAGRAMGMPKSTVSRKLAELEQRLGAALVQRTTRKMNLTDIGRAYYDHCARIVSEAEEAESAVTQLHGEPLGLLRITIPLTFSFVGSIVAEYLKQYAKVQVEIVATDRVVDLVEEGFDIGIRVGPMADSVLIARKLGIVRRFIVAGSDYVRRKGAPQSILEVEGHDCIYFSLAESKHGWQVQKDGISKRVRGNMRLMVNDFEVLYESTLAGLGLAILPADRCASGLQSGQLVRVLPNWQTIPLPVFAVFPHTRHLAKKTREFLDLLQVRIGSMPW